LVFGSTNRTGNRDGEFFGQTSSGDCLGDNQARRQNALGRGGKLAEAAFGWFRLAGWDAVVTMPPGDMRSVRQPKRMQGVFGCRAAGIAGPSGHAVRSVKIVRGFARQQIWIGTPVEAANGSNRGYVWVGWAGKPVDVGLRIYGDKVERSER